MAGRRFMTRSQFRIRYSGLRGSLRLWRDFFDDLGEARDLRRKRKQPRRRARVPSLLPGQTIPIDASALLHGLGAQQAARQAAQAQAINPHMIQQLASTQYGLSAQSNPYGMGGLMNGMMGAHYGRRWPF